MTKGKRNALLIVGVYLAVLGLAWIWFHPNFVRERVRENISIGASVLDVEKTFQVKAYHFPGAAYCGENGPSNIKKIAVDEVGKVPCFRCRRWRLQQRHFVLTKTTSL